MDEQQLMRLREHSLIRLDADGRFWHEDRPVTHAGVEAAFRRGLGRAADGRATLTVAGTWCFLEVEDSLWRATHAACEERDGRLAACTLTLDDGSREALELRDGGLALAGDGVLYARVRGEWVRLRPAAHAALGRFVDGDDAPVLQTVDGPKAVAPLPRGAQERAGPPG